MLVRWSGVRIGLSDDAIDAAMAEHRKFSGKNKKERIAAVESVLDSLSDECPLAKLRTLTVVTLCLRTFGLLRSSWLPLHLLLRIFGRARASPGLLVHGARRRVLISFGICTDSRAGVAWSRARTSVAHFSRFAGVAWTRLDRRATETQRGCTN